MNVQPDPESPDRVFVAAPEFGAEFEVSGNCPVQAFGVVFGRELYFRARHDRWSFDVANCDGDLPSDGHPILDGFYREGEFPDAGRMKSQEAVEIIVRCLEEHTGIRAQPPAE